MVDILLGKGFLTIAGVSPGHVVKKPVVIAVVHDYTTVLKASIWRYCIMSSLVDRV